MFKFVASLKTICNRKISKKYNHPMYTRRYKVTGEIVSLILSDSIYLDKHC